MLEIKFIVTGTGRCGTVYLAKLLTDLDVFCGHETVFDVGSTEDITKRLNDPKYRHLSICSKRDSFLVKEDAPKWVDVNQIVADSSYLAAPFLNDPKFINCSVIHVIRNPVDVISSFMLDFKYFQKQFYAPNIKTSTIYDVRGYHNFIWKYLPDLSFIENQLDRAAWFYIRWNEMIESYCKDRNYLRVNIENLDKRQICQFVSGNFDKIPNSFNDKKSNTNKKSRFSVDLKRGIKVKLIRDALIEKAYQYGYDI